MKMDITEKTYLAHGDPSLDISDEELDELFSAALSNALSDLNNAGPAIILPPDITRIHSRGGFLTDVAFRQVANNSQVTILPALGTHRALTAAELDRMFPNLPKDKFLVHDWRNDLYELGRLDKDWVYEVMEGAVNYDWPVQVNKLLKNEAMSLIISIGQVVPHEVAGMANHLKNVLIGTGGKEAIDKSHFAGAAYGMERIMGRVDTPVRAFFDEGFRRFGNQLPPVLWILTVVDSHAVRGLYIGFGRECFEKAAALSREVNVSIMDESIQKAVVYLAPEEYRSTWLGNKAIYRTRMAMADGGELLILAPGLECFGEDRSVDALIRKHGYRPKAEIMDRIAADAELADNLCAAAHLIHGSSEDRFTIRYCPGAVSQKEIESAGLTWGDLQTEAARYDVTKMHQGWNRLKNGEKIFFVPNPALGLWVEKQRYAQCYGKMPRIL
ncbi:MAG: lactate racemase domain-containing protein [Treponema sp.]|nr:lactate racemase domain-containing protein [Treponema sp.]